MTQHRINRGEFLATIEMVHPGLSTKDLIQQSSCYVFQQGWVLTFNGEVACRTKTPLPPEFEGAVPADELLKCLNNLQDDFVVIGKEDNKLNIRNETSRKRLWIRMEPEILLPIEEVERPEAWVRVPEDFDAAMRQVHKAAGNNKEEFLTVCVHIHPDWLEACDRFQACRYTIKTGASRPFLVREESIRHIVSLGMTKMGETDHWVHFRNQRLIYSCRRHLEQFPDLSQLFAFRGEPNVLPSGGVDAAKLASVFSGEDKDNNKIMVQLSSTGMLVRGEGTNGGAEVDLEMKYKGEPTAFRINPQLLIELITNHSENGCEIGPGKLRITGEKWVYVTVLGKLKEEKSERKPDEETPPKKKRRAEEAPEEQEAA